MRKGRPQPLQPFYQEEVVQPEYEEFLGPLTEEEIKAFALQIGMHPIRDKELLWFAEQSWLLSS